VVVAPTPASGSATWLTTPAFPYESEALGVVDSPPWGRANGGGLDLLRNGGSFSLNAAERAALARYLASAPANSPTLEAILKPFAEAEGEDVIGYLMKRGYRSFAPVASTQPAPADLPREVEQAGARYVEAQRARAALDGSSIPVAGQTEIEPSDLGLAHADVRNRLYDAAARALVEYARALKRTREWTAEKKRCRYYGGKNAKAEFFSIQCALPDGHAGDCDFGGKP
jgi:hypothetical protein